MTPTQRVEQARLVMVQARHQADTAAAAYRAAVKQEVDAMRAGGKSVRACARELGLSETALRDLLRPAGASRRK